MLKGLEKNLIPFLKKITLEDGLQNTPNNKSQYNEYYGVSKQDSDYTLSITMDFCIKKDIDSVSLNGISDFLNSMSLQTVFIDNEKEFTKFLSLNNNKKVKYLNNLKTKDSTLYKTKKISFIKSSIGSYISAYKDNNQVTRQQINIPLKVTCRYKEGLTKNDINPLFLANVYFLTSSQGLIIHSSMRSEILFRGFETPDLTGYFVIDNEFKYEGASQVLTKVNIENDRFLNPVTGESLDPNSTNDPNRQVNYLFGAPGDIWTGPVHIHPITDPTDINFGQARIMAGGEHDNRIPHPFLKYVVQENKKIIDIRDTVTFQDSFSYKFSANSVLSELKTPIYTQERLLNSPIDDFIKNKSIFSNCKFSIRPISRQRGSNDIKTKDNVVLFFGLDKNELLKETTKMPELLDSLTLSGLNLTNKLVNSIEINYFEITRIDKTENSSKILIVGNNDNEFNDFKTVNQLNKNISKGFSLQNKTNQIFLENGTRNGKINLYEFTDGEIDALKDNKEYCYKIKIKFRDPMIDFISKKLSDLDKIIYDLDDLLQKLSMKMIDPETGRQVKVFDDRKDQLNATFIQQSLNSSTNSFLPLNFSFDRESQLPNSINKEIQVNGDMSRFFSAISRIFSNDSFNINPPVILDYKKFIKFVRNSLMLSNTTPTLVAKNRFLFALFRDRVEKLLNIFSTQKPLKSINSYKNYLKSARDAVEIEDGRILNFEYTFKESIDLSKVGDNFNWIEESQPEASDGLKIITNRSYTDLVENKNIVKYLNPIAQSEIDALFDYSFLPYSSPAVLNFNKVDKINVHLNHLQSLRKKLIQDTANYPDFVLVPELLSTFGIRFLSSKTDASSYITDQRNYDENNIPINSGFEDNFGSEYSSLMAKFNSKDLSFGSTESDMTSWAGGEYEDYPSITAYSILNLITTKAFDRRNIDFFFKQKKTLPSGTRIPYAIDLFSNEQMINRQTADVFISNILDNLFDSNGLMKFEQYSYFSYLFNIFARVYYLKGFEVKRGESFGNEVDRFSPTSRSNFSFIKQMAWVPLTSSALNGIPSGKTIACKVMLSQEQELSNIIDASIVDMYKKYFNYNKIFLIKRSGQVVTRTAATENNFSGEDSQPAIVVADNSFGEISRRLVDKEIEMLNSIIRDENLEKSKKDPKDEIVTKKLMNSHNVKTTTFKKLLRR